MNRDELDEGVYITKERLAEINKLNEKYAIEIKENHWAITSVIYEVPYLSDAEHYCKIWYSYKDLKTNKICEGKKEFIDSDTFDLTLQSVSHYLKNFDKEYEGKYSLIENE